MNSNNALSCSQAVDEADVLKNALADPDAQPLGEEVLNSMVRLESIPGNSLMERLHNLKKRAAKQSLTVRYDADIIAYYKAKGKGYQQAMNNALRVCMEAEKDLLHS